MKVLLLAWSASGQDNYSYYPPIHQAYLAAALREAGHEVRMFDFCDDFSRYHRVVKRAADYAPDVVGYTVFTPYITLTHRIHTAMRSALPKAVFVAGGGHASCCREEILEQFPGLDYAIAGEAEHSFVQLVGAIAGRGDAEMESISGLTWTRGGELVLNERTAPPQDLDALAMPARDLLEEYYNDKMYWHFGAPGAVDMIVTSRGCAFDCGFCFKVETSCRFRSPDNVLEELEAIRSRGIRDIDVMDDSFTLKRARAVEILERIIENRMDLRLKIRSRVNAVDPDLLDLCKRAGVRKIVYGVESGSQTMLDAMNKKTTVDMNRHAIRITRQAGIVPVADIMIGMPGETPETIEETNRFLAEEKPVVTSVPVLYPLPATPVWKQAEREGTLRGAWTVGGKPPWVQLPWARSKYDIALYSVDMTRRLHRNPGWLYEVARTFGPGVRSRHIKFAARQMARSVKKKFARKPKAA